jgi:hypothetical protein
MERVTKIQEALALIAEAEERTKRAREILEREVGAPAAGVWVGGLILAEVYREGGSVTRARLHEIAKMYGMDNRGLGGFFTGRGSLQALDDVDRVMLTPEGVKAARSYLNRPGTPYKAAEPNYARAAEASFAEDWDSPEDSVYDDA